MMMEEAHSNESKFTLIEITQLVYKELVELGMNQDDKLFYTYQYDLRWCLQRLRKEEKTSFRKEGGINIHYLTN